MVLAQSHWIIIFFAPFTNDGALSWTTLAQCLLKSLSHPLFGDRTCPHCSNSIPTNQTFFSHLCQQHIEFETENLCELLENSDEEIFNLATLIQNISVPSTSGF